MLQRLRVDTGVLRGRKFPEPPHAWRSDFQRDRDRVIHSRAFRRMEGKTQVFAAGLSDHFRNRLTHSIEVSQVARTVAVRLALNEEFTETLALAHDLGHPPFAHSGEHELDLQMRRFGSYFEHNQHSLRVVDHLEERYARFPGINLTFEVREGIVKHSREVPADETNPVLLEFLPGLRPPLEAQLLDLADEIAYNTADLDDAFSAELFSMDEISRHVPLFADFTDQVDTQFPGATPRIRFWEVQRQLMSFLVGGLIEGTCAAADSAGVRNVDDVRQCPRRLAAFTPDAKHVNNELRAFLSSRLYSQPALKHDREIAVQRLGRLFQFFIDHPERISSGYRERLKDEPVHRVVCDYIAGMTDAYFLRVYTALLGPD